MAESILRDYTSYVHKATKIHGWDGKLESLDKPSTTDLQWSFAGSLLFAITVITTIGQYLVLPPSFRFKSGVN